MPQPKPTYTAEDYWALPEGVRAELIEGKLCDSASPIRAHQRIVLKLSKALDDHIESHGGSCEVYTAPFAVNLFADDTTFVEPDVSVVCDHDKLSDRGCEGAPDFIAEVVSPSNPGMDYISKLHEYQAAGVQEYWIVDPLQSQTTVYVFDAEMPMRVFPFSQAVPSAVFPGFSMDFAHVMTGM